MKKPTKNEVIIAVVLMFVWFCVMMVFTHYDLERAGSLTIGAVVGATFALFGYSATEGVRNTVMILSVSFIATMVYNMVASMIHYFL